VTRFEASSASPTAGEEPSIVAAVTSGDEPEFGRLFELHRRELRVHCYRMLGNLEDAENVVQETFVKAWRNRAGFAGRSSFRAWLYRIATNSCLDTIKRKRRRVATVPAGASADHRPSFDDVPWLQPIPDRYLDATAGETVEPEALVMAKETIELAFLAAIQHLPPRPRAVLILRDVLGWSASETAELLEGSTAAVNSALQRARERLRQLGRADGTDWTPVTPPSVEERELLQRYMDAHARADAAAVIELLGEDIRIAMPPDEAQYDGHDAVATFFRNLFGSNNPGDWRLVPTLANRQPAAANYVRQWGDTAYRGITLDVLRIEDGVLVEITTFDASVFPAFGLPPTL
jgi:RNA polymerase sigma-70 factor (ECF subfamily)